MVEIINWVSNLSEIGSHILLFYGAHKGKVIILTSWLVGESSQILMVLVKSAIGIYNSDIFLYTL